ncbi:hypothetical protein, partial [Niastella populi]|uniref:hypothetical protein n=1 Tax=Niastella populi TaxID=550983 RepID=UPI001A997B07
SIPPAGGMLYFTTRGIGEVYIHILGIIPLYFILTSMKIWYCLLVYFFASGCVGINTTRRLTTDIKQNFTNRLEGRSTGLFNKIEINGCYRLAFPLVSGFINLWVPFADYFNTRVSNIILDADNWKILNVMAGGFYQIPINNKLNIKSQILAGISSSKKPAYKVTLKDSQNDLTYFGNDLKTVFCYRLGTEFNYSLYRSIYLLADINYFSTSAAKASNSNDISAYRYSSLNMSAGVGFGF